MMKNEYWAKRIQKEQQRVWEQGFRSIHSQLGKQYTRAYEDTLKDMSDLWDEMTRDTDKVTPNDLYKFNRFYELQNTLFHRLTNLGLGQNNLFAKKLMEQYRNNFEAMGKFMDNSVSFTLEQQHAAEEIIKAIWCSDGKNWSTRIWGNMTKLQFRIEDGLLDSVVRGVSKDELVKTLAQDFHVGFSDADRIARTELTYVQNQACRQRYEEAGITEYKFLAEIDGRTSDICKGLNGKIYRFSDAVVGKNFPPCHPNCRSTIVPVIE